VTLSLYALRLGASPLAVGLLASTFSIFPMLLAVTAGRLVDRIGSRWPMTVGAATGAVAMLVPYVFEALPALYVAGTMTGLSAISFNLATQNLVGQLSTPETRPRNFSNYMLTAAAASLLGPLLAGFSIEHSSHARTCLHLSLVALAPLTLLLARGGGVPGGSHRAGKAAGGVLAMLRDPVVRHTLIAGSLINTGLNLYQWYLPVYGHSIDLSSSSIGMILAANSAAAFVVRFALPKLLAELGERTLLACAFFAGATGLLLIPLFHNALALGIVSFMFGFGMGAGQPIVIMLMYTNSRDGRSGESLGLKVMTNQLTKLVSPVIFGAVASGFGLLAMFWLNAILLAGGGMMSRRKEKQS
jgi:MFS family permease